MKAELITIGDEILIGQIVDTNSAWMAKQLNEVGVEVNRIVSISDEESEIKNAFKDCLSRVDLVLVTGGLGPTKDDITKKVIADYFGKELVFKKEIFEDVKEIFNRFGKKMPASNRSQAEVPSGALTFKNNYGTAPGMWIEDNGKVLVSMPGVPYEMKGLMQEGILNKIKEHFQTKPIYHRTILTSGLGESALMELIEEWEDEVRSKEIGLAYLPSPGRVRLRLSKSGYDEILLKSEIDSQIEKLYKLIPELIFGEEEDHLEKVIGKLLREKGCTISTAESCTGGYIAHLLTSVSGSSSYFKGSVVSYANEVKSNFLNVSMEDIEKYGAVSSEVVEQMAKGVQSKMKTDFAIATSGIAGPDGGTTEKPVGTIWIGIATPNKVYSTKFTFGKNREKNIQRFAVEALSLLRKELLKY